MILLRSTHFSSQKTPAFHQKPSGDIHRQICFDKSRRTFFFWQSETQRDATSPLKSDKLTVRNVKNLQGLLSKYLNVFSFLLPRGILSGRVMVVSCRGQFRLDGDND
ncbi:hypothetical protein CEXT_252731 [Caerostris extrusa]|uniref:Uncharacterized protein n=1 Tax=Caerostris extrusa TaxID=172846 RepID=A0AAV4MWW2_CAEEX|nr:hypothetical protein CEXT_252731 [Caerostris extrusa]